MSYPKQGSRKRKRTQIDPLRLDDVGSKIKLFQIPQLVFGYSFCPKDNNLFNARQIKSNNTVERSLNDRQANTF
jgi:hypothetical protein